MQRDIMKYRADSVSIEGIENRPPIDPWRENYIIHMAIVFAALGQDRPTKRARRFQRRKHLVIALPDRQTLGRDVPCIFHLRPEKGRGEVARQKRGPDLLPRVFVHFATEETAAIRPLLSDDLSPECQVWIIYQEAAALTRNDVFAVVKAVRAQVAKRAKRSPVVTSQDALSGVLNNF